MNRTVNLLFHSCMPAALFAIFHLPAYIYFLNITAGDLIGFIPFWLGISLLGFAVYIILHRKHIKLMRTGAEGLGDDREEMDDYLLSMGAMPLKTLVNFVILLFLYLGGLFLIYQYVLAIPKDKALIFTGIMAGYGLLSGGFTYVYMDNLVLEVLKSDGITYFPLDVQVNRQKAKGFIIPAFITVKSLVITVFVVIYALFDQAGVNHGEQLSLMGAVLGQIFWPLLVYVIITILLIRQSSSNVGKLYSQVLGGLEHMTTGDKDLTRRIPVVSVDELASVSQHINVFTDLISNQIRETGLVYRTLTENQSVLAESVGESAQSMNEIAVLLEKNGEMARSMGDIVEDSARTGRILTENVADSVKFVSEQSASMESSSAAVEEMIASISEVTGRTGRVRGRTEKLTKEFAKGEESVNRTIESVSGTAELSKELLNINSLISGIAAQTNLLAMNAAIEAAHAGDAGRGFAVVADEIRKLAENTASHTKSSGNSLKRIMGEIESSLQIARETGEMFESMKEGINTINEESLSISRSMSEHDTANRQVLEQLMKTRELSERINQLGDSLTAQSRSLIEAFGLLEENNRSTLDNSRIVMDNKVRLTANLDRLREASLETERLSRRTGEMLLTFKVD